MGLAGRRGAAWRVVRTAGFGIGALVALAGAPIARADGDAEERLRKVEDHLEAVRDELASLKEQRHVDESKVADLEQQVSTFSSLLDRVRMGGYASMRYEDSNVANQKDTFTLRRMVLTTEAQIHPRITFYSELEFERFRELELERSAFPANGGLTIEQEIEGTNESEIALEQAWVQFQFHPMLNFRAGGVLVPIGRFNLHHDDDLWLLPRRTLVDRGVPVIPIPSAWDELGAGLNGNIPIGETNLGYQFYVVNGAAIEGELEEVAKSRQGRRAVLELEGVFTPQTGTFSNDIKDAKAVTGRVAWSPGPGHEIAASFYTGRYTPDYLQDESVTSLSVDGITGFYGLELEGEFVTTGWNDVEQVAASFARTALSSEINNSSAFDPTLEPEIAFKLNPIARRKTGYWIEARYPFWPEWLPRFGFDQPQIVPVARFEQVWFDHLLSGLTFRNGVVQGYTLDARQLNRATVGLAYRPMPSVALTLAWEYLYTGGGSLVGLTNYVPARANEGSATSLLTGITVGF
ncbi:hypothetical protein MYXO_00897 [Myxococcaceae bacterium]|jgi:hypothetical protein|nr:hypothetical protein MYXO_00897 [Myxococcaceae bacterium]